MNYICNCKKHYFFDRSYAYWEDRAVTSDEMDIINFLDNKKNSIKIGTSCGNW